MFATAAASATACCRLAVSDAFSTESLLSADISCAGVYENVAIDGADETTACKVVLETGEKKTNANWTDGCGRMRNENEQKKKNVSTPYAGTRIIIATTLQYHRTRLRLFVPFLHLPAAGQTSSVCRGVFVLFVFKQSIAATSSFSRYPRRYPILAVGVGGTIVHPIASPPRINGLL